MNFDRIQSINSNKKENVINSKMVNKNLKFKNEELNLDTNQNLLMQKRKDDLIKNNTLEFTSNGYESINDRLDYVECLNGNCSKIECVNGSCNKKDNVNNIMNQLNVFNEDNSIFKSLDILISFIYIFLLVILLLGSVIKRDANNLIYILIITLIYVFYKITIGHNK